jgi:hypothetical protein
MASGRFLSTTVATDHQVAMLSIEAEALYLRAIPHLDRDGLLTGDPMRLLAMVAPLRFSALIARIADLVEEWVAVGLVTRYGSPDGPVLWFKGFAKNQVLRYDRERASVYPPPPGHIRTDAGLQRVTDLPWHEQAPPTPDDSGVVRSCPDFAVQAEAEEQAEAKAEAEEQAAAAGSPQPHSAPPPAAPAAAAADPPSEAAAVLADFGIAEPWQSRLAGCNPALARGWMWEATRPGSKVRDPVAFVIARLKARDKPPRTFTAQQWAELHAPPEPPPPPTDHTPPPGYTPPWAPVEVDPEAERLWRAAAGELQLQVTPDVFEMYLHPLRPGNFDDGTLHLHAPNAQVGQWIDIRLRRPVERTLASIHGQPVQIAVIASHPSEIV